VGTLTASEPRLGGAAASQLREPPVERRIVSESYPPSGSGQPAEGSSGGEQPPTGQYGAPGTAPSDQSGYRQSYGAPSSAQGGYGSSSETSVNQPFASPGGYGPAAGPAGPPGAAPSGGAPQGAWGAQGYGSPAGGQGYGSSPSGAAPYGGYGQQPSGGGTPYGSGGSPYSAGSPYGGAGSPYGRGQGGGGSSLLSSPSGVGQLLTIIGYVVAGLGLLAFILTLATDTAYGGSTVFKLAQALIALITGLGFGAVCVGLGSLLKQRSGS
jgi:hypothetical protein